MQPIHYGKKTTRGKLTPTILAYIAGIIDGEGSILISKTQNKKSRSWQYILMVECANSHQGVIDFLTQLFNNYRTTTFYRPPKKDTYKPSYQWMVAGQLALRFLKIIYPYLWIKREEAILGIEFQELKMKESKQTKGIKLTESVIATRERYYQKMKELKVLVQPQRLSEITQETVMR